MKKILLATLFLLIFGVSDSAFALLKTNNVHKEDFKYEVPYFFASEDLTQSMTAIKVGVGAVNGSSTDGFGDNFFYVVSRDGFLTGMSVAMSTPLTNGAATFDVTINGTVTGVQVVIEDNPVRTAVGTTGSSGDQFGFIRQDRSDTNAADGFKGDDEFTLSRHNSDNPFGRATPLTAGNRIGLKLTTDSTLLPGHADAIITIYVLQ